MNLAKWLALSGLSFLAFASVQAEVPSGYRVALLIGNSEYDDFTLPGSEKSLDTVEQALEQLDFQVVRHTNLDQDKLTAAIDAFSKSVPTNAVVVVYYHGLGANVERLGTLYNVLRPLDAEIRNENDYRSRGVQVAEMLETLRQQSGARLSLFFLDGCWQSPLKPENDKVQNGFREFEVGDDCVVMFAAASQQWLPLPNGDDPSPFAQSLAKHLRRVEGSIEQACQAIAEENNDAWYAGLTETGLGEGSDFPIAESLRNGKSPGEGYVNSIGMTFRWCPAGNFRMGSEQTDSAATRDRKPVSVTLSQGYWIGEYEVTQREYDVVRRRSVPRGFTQAKNAPFWGVAEAKHVEDFCKRLTEFERKAGNLPKGWEYACPTEAEWEYACRAGSQTAFCFGDSPDELGQYGNFADQSLFEQNPNYYWANRKARDGFGEELAPVGSFRPNAWGIRDMHGNVAELVADHLLPERPGGTDPLVRVKKDGVTQIRGGAWCSMPLYCESSFRNALSGRDKENYVGFRVVLKQVK